MYKQGHINKKSAGVLLSVSINLCSTYMAIKIESLTEFISFRINLQVGIKCWIWSLFILACGYPVVLLEEKYQFKHGFLDRCKSLLNLATPLHGICLIHGETPFSSKNITCE
uniref:Uncharacterized protein n=1 Tax=Glossina austeni TaxID=7395 RepID=A0A1A9VH21_GLOAU